MEKKILYKNLEMNNQYNQKPYYQLTKLYEEYNNNNIKNSYEKKINKDSYMYLNSKKLNNNKKNNNLQSFDFSEPEPQIFQGFTKNNNNSFDAVQKRNEIISKNNIASKKISNNKLNINNSNRNNNKLLEEYFQLKKDNNYNTLNNIYSNQKKGKNSNLIQKNKTKKSKEQKRDISFKKSSSLKDNLLQIYQPEKTITNSPSFTPIRSNFPKQRNISNKKEKNYFNSKSNVNINVSSKSNSINNIARMKKYNNKFGNSEEESLNSKKINNFNDYQNEKNRNQTTRKNLTPSKIKGIWVETNNINYNKTYSIDKDENNNNYNINNNIYNNNYINSNNSKSNKSNIYSLNSTELYWKKKEKEKEKKLEQIRTERILKEEKELQDRPRINKKSKKIINKKMKNIDVFDRLSDLNQIKNHNEQIEKMREQLKESYTPYINDNSKKMKRTIDDLYNWKNKNERKKTESANNFNKNMKKKQIIVNPLSEEILREKKSDYLNKKVEDRLLEQGRIQQYKNEIQKQKYISYITTGKKYINNDYINVHSRYLESPTSTNNNFNPKNYKSCDRITKRDNMHKYKNLSLNNNNNNNISFSYDKENNYEKNEKNNYNNDNLIEKQIYFNNNDNKLINGNIIAYNFNSNMLKNENNNSDNYYINNNIKENNNLNNNYQYFPNYNKYFHHQNENNNKNYTDILNNYKELKAKYKYNSFETENNYNYNKGILNSQNNSNRKQVPLKLINNYNNEKKLNNISFNNNNNINSYNSMNNYDKNDIINIRKHLNEFYENKKKLNVNNSNKIHDSNEIEKSLKKDESVKNDLLKELLNKSNKTQNNEYYNIKQIEQSNWNKNENNNSNKNNEIKPKYNFKPEIIKDVNKIPKSGGLNFNTNKNINYFQFPFNKYNKNNSEYKIIDYDIKNDNNINNINQNNIKINNNNQNQNNLINEDNININGLVQNSNSNLINNEKNINEPYKNSGEKEKERRKQDLLQMMNYSSKFGNDYLNNNILNKNNFLNNFHCNKNDIENFNGVQSYEDIENN